MHATTHAQIAQPIGFGKLRGLITSAVKLLGVGAPIADLVIRLWVAKVFWASGLTKIQSIDTTLLLFQYEYSVPLLPPDIAAYLAIFAELMFSALLAIGLAGRLSAIGLFFVNVVAVISYPALEAAGLQQHYLWGLLLLVPIFHGPGKLSADYLIARWFNHGRP